MKKGRGIDKHKRNTACTVTSEEHTKIMNEAKTQLLDKLEFFDEQKSK